jgi:iron-regulated transporter 1
LAVNIVAPIAVGQVMYFLSHIVAAVIIAAWNVVSFFVEFLVLRDIYNDNPQLAIKQNVDAKPPDDGLNAGELNIQLISRRSQFIKLYQNIKEGIKQNGLTKRFGGFLKTWGIYFSHEVRNAGIALAFLYMTVLGFDSITTGYAYSQGVPESVLGVIGAVGAGVGLIGSVTFPFLVKRFGINKTG